MAADANSSVDYRRGLVCPRLLLQSGSDDEHSWLHHDVLLHQIAGTDTKFEPSASRAEC